jgi:head-tail adaptor
VSDWPKLNPGDLRKVIQFQRQPDQTDGIGQVLNIWPTYLTCAAAIDDLITAQRPQGREQYDEGLISSRATHVITIRWPGRNYQIQAGDRIYWADQMYSPPAIHTYTVEWAENIQNRNIVIRILVWEINAPT